MLVSSEVILFSLLLSDAMHVGGAMLQFGGSLVVFEMRSVVITS
jgi:hypothetical protein